jgi:hypothetical protein
VTIVGSWIRSKSVRGYYGANYLHNDASDPGAKSVTYHFTAEVSGKYRILTFVPNEDNRDAAVPILVSDADDNTQTFTVNQTQRVDYEFVGEVDVPAGPVRLNPVQSVDRRVSFACPVPLPAPSLCLPTSKR